MRHAILGAGGVGGLIGVALAKSGESVTLVLRPEVLKNYPAELSLESPLGSFSAPVDRAASVAAPYDVLWVTVKATQLESALRSVTVDPDQIGAVVPVLNGMDHVALLRARFGHDRVVPASIGVESERVAPGKIIHRGMAIRLAFSSVGETRLASTAEEFRKFGFACQFVADEMKLLWTKLSILAPFALFDKRPLDGRSSMQKDVAAGNPPELDGIAGPILRRAEEHGIDVPVTRELVDLIRRGSNAAKAAER